MDSVWKWIQVEKAFKVWRHSRAFMGGRRVWFLYEIERQKLRSARRGRRLVV